MNQKTDTAGAIESPKADIDAALGRYEVKAV